MKINRLAVLICFILVFSTFMSSFTVSSKIVTDSIEKTNISNSFLEKNGYIIKLRGDPLFVFEKNLTKSNLYGKIEEKVNDHKDQFLSLHSTAKEKILDLIDCNCKSDCFFIEEFTNVFNGFAVSNIPEKIVRLIESLPFVEGVYPNRIFKVNLQDSVPLINADDVWELQNTSGINVTGEGVNVAVLDTGIDYNHSVFGGGFGPGYQVVDGYDFVTCDHFNLVNYECDSPKSEDDNPMDDNGHGTHCAGIVTGVAPNVSLYAYKILNKDGVGAEAWLFSALERAVDPNQDGNFSDHMNVVSMSFGLFSPGSSDNPSNPDDQISRTVDMLVDSGIVFVAAAGNRGPSAGTIQSPACARKAIAVGSTDKNDKISLYSSRGPTPNGTIKPDVVAPGISINSTWLDNGYSTQSGTSMACPHVAGIAALILQKHPDWEPLEVKMAIRNTALDLGYDIMTQGWGRVDAYAAVNLSEAPPIAFLNTSESFNTTLIDIYGTAAARDFQNYKLFYKKENEWIKIHESTIAVSNGKLFTWNVSSIPENKICYFKLEVNSVNQTSTDMVLINIGSIPENDDVIIEVKNQINESSFFNVKIFDKNFVPMNAFVLFYSQMHLPKIRYGSEITFRAPSIYLPFVNSIKAKIIVIKLVGKKVAREEIEIINSN